MYTPLRFSSLVQLTRDLKNLLFVLTLQNRCKADVIKTHFQNSPRGNQLVHQNRSNVIWRKKGIGREREMENFERDLIRKHQCMQLSACASGYLIANCHLMQSSNFQTNRHRIDATHQLEFFPRNLVYSNANAFVLQLSAPSSFIVDDNARVEDYQ